MAACLRLLLILGPFICYSSVINTSIHQSFNSEYSLHNSQILQYSSDSFLTKNKTPFLIDLDFSYIRLASVRDMDVEDPAFIGGNDSVAKIIGSRLRIKSKFCKTDSLISTINFNIDTNGLVKSVEMRSFIDSSFDNQLINIVKGLKFVPGYYKKTGVAIERNVFLRIKIKFLKKKNGDHY